jgi:acetylornithine deacetylase/succinyl-diaminopimelate desuccinylase-like protein
LNFRRIARVVHDKGYPGAGTSMNLPVSRALIQIVDDAAGEPAVKLPPLGGSVPAYIFENLHLPVIGVPMVNYDDNQHAPNENLRVGNLWRGIEIYGAILAGLHW